MIEGKDELNDADVTALRATAVWGKLSPEQRRFLLTPRLQKNGPEQPIYEQAITTGEFDVRVVLPRSMIWGMANIRLDNVISQPGNELYAAVLKELGLT